MAAAPTRLYLFFHCNLAFSSIEEAARPQVVARCYWPILNLARDTGVPVGLEATAWTLERIAEIDPAWIVACRELMGRGLIDFIGSGHAQIIGPLVPGTVNQANLAFGMQGYQRLLGCTPRLALVNEQAYAPGLLPLYAEAGYHGLIMEWDNCRLGHPEWDPGLRFAPQRAMGAGCTLPVVWNHSIAFQKMQRLAHSDLDEAGYLAWLRSESAPGRCIPVYGNDAETFDFRPGRFSTETERHDGEWARIAAVIRTLRDDPLYRFVAPTRLLDEAAAGRPLRLESPEQPIPVKKQPKYNLNRWAGGGHCNILLNTRCCALHAALLRDGVGLADPRWRELCELWASDHRTHLTALRRAALEERLAAREAAWNAAPPARPAAGTGPVDDGRLIECANGQVRIILNRRRGLAIDRLWFASLGPEWVLGTLEHGFFDDIRWGADFYSNLTVLELPGRPKITDLAWAETRVSPTADGGVVVEGSIDTPLGPVRKRISLPGHGERVEIGIELAWPVLPAGSLRLGDILLNPRAFDISRIAYACANGGHGLDVHHVGRHDVDHGQAVSFLTSATTALGCTDGRLILGDDRRAVQVEIDQTSCAATGLITSRRVGSSRFCRAAFSLREMDDTVRAPEAAIPGGLLRFTAVISPALPNPLAQRRP